MKKFNKIIILIIVAFSLSQCSLLSKKSVNVFLRKDVNTEKSRIIVFPMLLAQPGSMKAANEKFSNPALDTFLGKNWYDYIGKKNVVVIPKIALDKIPHAYEVLDYLIKALDITSAIEQNEILKEFIDAVSNKFGDGALAFALVSQNEDQYKNSGIIQLKLGLFDMKKLTWKWIVKSTYQSKIYPLPYQAALQDLVKDAFSKLKEKNNGQVR